MIKITIRNRNFNKLIILCLLIALPVNVFALENSNVTSNTGVYRPGVGFYLKMDNSSTWNPATDVYLGWDNAAGDLPVAGDWNADGRSETGVVPARCRVLSEDGQQQRLEPGDGCISWVGQCRRRPPGCRRLECGWSIGDRRVPARCRVLSEDGQRQRLEPGDGCISWPGTMPQATSR